MAWRPKRAGRGISVVLPGSIDAEGSVKTAQFIQACDQADMSLVFPRNTTGYRVGGEAEARVLKPNTFGVARM